MVRETPLHAGHIALMDQATRSGAIIMPPVPGFYTKPETIDDLISQTVGRALDLFDVNHPSVRRWNKGGGILGKPNYRIELQVLHCRLQ